MDHSKAHSARKWNKTSGEVHQVQSSNNEHDVHTEERKRKTSNMGVRGWRDTETVRLSNDKRKKQKSGKENRIKGQENINQMYQRKNNKNGNKHRTEETSKEKGGKNITYEIEELRANPQKQGMAENEQEEKKIVERIAQQEREKEEHNKRAKIVESQKIRNNLEKELRGNKKWNSQKRSRKRREL